LTADNAVQAFVEDEHRDLSNEALRLASALLVLHGGTLLPSDLDAERLRQAQQALSFLLQESAKSGHPDYGSLVLAVDHYSIVPTQDFRGAREFEDQKESQLGLRNKRRAYGWAVGLRHLQALHTNELHFQGGAVAGLESFHAEAARLAAKANDAADLERAFLRNAIADLM